MGEDSLLRTASAQRSVQGESNPIYEVGTCIPADKVSGDTASRPSSLSLRGVSSWRAGIIVAAAATTLFAMVGLMNLASNNETSQPPFGAFSPEFEERPLAGTQQANIAQSKYYSAPEYAHAVTKGVDLLSKSASLSFEALNEYTRRGDVIGVGYPWLEGKILVEPHRKTSLEVIAPVGGMIYVWKIVDKMNPAIVLGEFEGAQIEVVFHVSPKYTVELLEQESDGTISRRTEVDIFCKYVRREIRSLTDEERDEMFDAMKVRTVQLLEIHT